MMTIRCKLCGIVTERQHRTAYCGVGWPWQHRSSARPIWSKSQRPVAGLISHVFFIHLLGTAVHTVNSAKLQLMPGCQRYVRRLRHPYPFPWQFP